MNVKVILIFALLLVALVGFSQTTLVSETFQSSSLSNWITASGNWRVMVGRLVQSDIKETMATISRQVSQSGTVQFEFDVRYVGGGEDDYAGFGVHVAVNNPSRSRSWGNGESFLAWVTWDPKAYGAPGGFVQLYKSTGPTSMDLYPVGDIMKDGARIPIPATYLKPEFLALTAPVKIILDLTTGKGRFYDPTDMNYYFPFNLGAAIKTGSHFSFRTNSVAVSIDNFKVTKLK
jgi:hypothetical protein